ncbi:MAG: methylated-DNA--[protein]-cysteine S-methyltransferase [Neisseria sp.]|nr:methylated-DNA--[protein]-cysteine S-methyltransferase [Neisseria sp.]
MELLWPEGLLAHIREIDEHADFQRDYAAAKIQTALGEMLAVFAPEGLSLLEFPDGKGVEKELSALKKAAKAEIYWHSDERAEKLARELVQYFAGTLESFQTALSPVGTDFQKRAWQVLQSIPYGEVLSYREQAERLGNPKAVRAVAAANGQNKISILIPCHRVIGSNGKLVGYAGGLHRKQALLNLEHCRCVLSLD